MSIGYSCYLIPEPDSREFVPSAAQVVAVMNVLADLRWIGSAAEYTVRTRSEGKRHTTIHAATIGADVDLLLTRAVAFVVELPEVPAEAWWPDAPRDADGQSRKYEFTDDARGVLGPQYCFGGRLCWAPSLFSVPSDNQVDDTPTPCPACGADVLLAIDRDDPALGALNDAEFFKVVPGTCGSCGAALVHRKLVMQMRSGITAELVPEDAPFGRFVVALDAPSPPRYPHHVEEPLLARLHETLGVRYRHVGRWQ